MSTVDNKVYWAGEYDWTGEYGGDSLSSFYDALESNPLVGGDAFWSLFGHDVPYCNVRPIRTDSGALRSNG